MEKNQALIDKLTEISEDKIIQLKKLISVTKKQMGCFKDEKLDVDSYEIYLNRMASKTIRLDFLMDEYEECYQKLMDSGIKLSEDEKIRLKKIEKMETQIAGSIEKISGSEEKVKSMFTSFMNQERVQINIKKKKRNVARSYYNNMIRQISTQGIFFDNKR